MNLEEAAERLGIWLGDAPPPSRFDGSDREALRFILGRAFELQAIRLSITILPAMCDACAENDVGDAFCALCRGVRTLRSAVLA